MNSGPEHYLLGGIKGEANVGLRVKVGGAQLSLQRENNVKEVSMWELSTHSYGYSFFIIIIDIEFFSVCQTIIHTQLSSCISLSKHKLYWILESDVPFATFLTPTPLTSSFQRLLLPPNSLFLASPSIPVSQHPLPLILPLSSAAPSYPLHATLILVSPTTKIISFTALQKRRCVEKKNSHAGIFFFARALRQRLCCEPLFLTSSICCSITRYFLQALYPVLMYK